MIFSRIALTLLILFACAALLFAQEPPAIVPDSVYTDSLATDSLRADTLAKKSEPGLDTLVFYKADSITFSVEGRLTVLSGDAEIRYKDMELKAGEITVDWDGQLLEAKAVPDTLFTDSTNSEIDTVIWRGKPHFEQNRDDFYGEEIAYNMKTKIGRVKTGTTTYDDGHYKGELFKRIAPDVITARHGEFTSCEKDTADYHFAANRLKIQVGKRVLARPVVLYFEDVPVFVVPYGIFPSQRGRSSGIIVPVFGESTSQGRFLRDIGYYWAPSQYMDLRGSMDYFEKFGILGGLEYRYAKRYVMNGGSTFAFNTQRQGSASRRDFQLGVNHSHIIDRNTRLTVSGRYTSNESFNQDVGTTQDLLTQSVNSNATLSKSWDNSPWSLSANLGYTQNIRKKNWSATLPRIGFSHKQGQIFPPHKAPRGLRGAVAPKELEPPWYRNFRWRYAVDYTDELSLPLTFKQEGLKVPPVYLNNRIVNPTTIWGDDSLSIVQREGMRHSGGINATARILKYVNLTPSLDLTQVWTKRVVNYQPTGKTFDRDDDRGLFTRTTFSVGTSASTKLYGLAERPFGLNASFRHLMTPTLGFRYTPNFADKKWGYYKTVSLADGRSYTFDRFLGSEMASNVGGTPKGLSELFSFGLDHLYQMKTGSAEDNTEKKFDLLSMGSSTSWDLVKDSLRWSHLNSSFRTSIPGTIIGPVQGVAFDVGTAHSFYQQVNGHPINKFFWERDDAKWYSPLELLNTTVSVSFSIRAESLGSLVGIGEETEMPTEFDSLTAVVDSMQLPLNPVNINFNERAKLPPPPSGGGMRMQEPSELYQMPLSMQISLRKSKDYVSRISSSSFAANANFQLTRLYSIDMSYSFDLDRKEVRDVRVSATRDLHCWEASFNWTPLGYRPGYYLRIALKSPQLKDVKIERHRGAGLRGY